MTNEDKIKTLISPVELSNKTTDWFDNMDKRRVEICIPTYNRWELTIDAFRKVLFDYRVKYVTIYDDCSTDDSYDRLKQSFKYSPKVRIYKGEKNLDCYFAKHKAVELATEDFVIILDSDNQIDASYLDAIYAQEWNKNTILAPEYLKPAFNFLKWSGTTLTKENVAQYANTALVTTSCNAMNFFINREEYLKIWDGSINPGTFDSLYFSYCWLKAGNRIHITPNMQYEHKMHPDNSNHFSTHQHKYAGFFNELMNKIKQLS